MNELIKELADQAKQCALDAMIKIADKEQALKAYSETYDTKFAELIVQSCIEMTRWKEFEMSVEQRIRLSVARDIKEHFGVEP